MMETIVRLWHGELEPVRYAGINDPNIKQLESLLQRNGEKLEKYLDEKGNDIFEKYNDCVKEYISVLSEQSFSDGFCLGTKLVAEALTFNEP